MVPVLLLFSPPLASCSSCPDFSLLPGSSEQRVRADGAATFYFFSGKQTWDGADGFCRGFGANFGLATFRDQEDVDLLLTLTSEICWIT